MKRLPVIFSGARPVMFTEASSPAYAAGGVLSEPDDYKYRMLSGGLRDLQPLEYNRANQLSYYVWQRNPLAKRIIQLLLDYSVGEAVSVTVDVKQRQKDGSWNKVDNPEVQRVWSDFAENMYDNFGTKLRSYIEELLTFGELHIPVKVNPANGDVSLGYYDSKLVDRIMVQQFTGQPESVVYRFGGAEEKNLKVIRPEIDPESEAYGKLSGDVFFFRINRLLSQTRGHSELLQLLDWLDGLDQFLFNTLEGAALRNAFFYWLKLNGATEEEVKAFKISTPKSGSVKVTNDKAEWSVITPDLKSMDTSETMRMFKNFILASKGLPEHWFAEGGYTNRATAQEMNAPSIKMLRALQTEVRNIIQWIGLFVIQQNTTIKDLGQDQRVFFQINLFDLERGDEQAIGQAFNALVQSLAVAKDNSWVSNDNAKQVVDNLMRRLGVAVDPTETVEDIQEENDEAKDEDDTTAVYDKADKDVLAAITGDKPTEELLPIQK